MSSEPLVKYRVMGMDCAGDAAEIENKVRRIAGETGREFPWLRIFLVCGLPESRINWWR